MFGPGQPQTCSHPINAQTLTGVCQVVRMLPPCQFHVYVSIGTLVSGLVQESNSKCIALFLFFPKPSFDVNCCALILSTMKALSEHRCREGGGFPGVQEPPPVNVDFCKQDRTLTHHLVWQDKMKVINIV